MPNWIRDVQLRKKLGDVSQMTLYRLRRAGKLPQPEKLNNCNYTREDVADAAIETLFAANRESRDDD